MRERASERAHVCVCMCAHTSSPTSKRQAMCKESIRSASQRFLTRMHVITGSDPSHMRATHANRHGSHASHMAHACKSHMVTHFTTLCGWLVPGLHNQQVKACGQVRLQAAPVQVAAHAAPRLACSFKADTCVVRICMVWMCVVKNACVTCSCAGFSFSYISTFDVK